MAYLKHISYCVTIIALISFINSCKKDEKETTSIRLTVPKKELKPFELALIEVNADLDTLSYSGSIESQKIEFKPNGRYFIFTVPSSTPGTKRGSVTIDGKDYDFRYQLTANSFSDPDVYLQEFLTKEEEQQTKLEDLQSRLIEDSVPGFENMQADLAVWDQIAADAQTELANLSAEERTKLAQIIDANSEWMQALDDALFLESTYLLRKSSKAQCKALIDQGRNESSEGRLFAAAATAIKAYWCAQTCDERQYEHARNNFERGLILLRDFEFGPGNGVLNTLTNMVGRKIDGLTKELQETMASNGIGDEILEGDRYKSSTKVAFHNGEPEDFFAKIRFRSVDENDAGRSDGAGQAASFFDQIIAAYNEMVVITNQPLVWRPDFTSTSVIKNMNQFLSIPKTSISNKDIVLINTQYVNDTWQVAFGNDGVEKEPEFSFLLKYDDGHVKLQKTIYAVLKEPCVNNSITYGSFTDPRDGYKYKTVDINGQVWFAENLRYAGTGASYTSSQYSDLYGRVYSYSDLADQPCPNGWHVSTDDDWKDLERFIGVPQNELDRIGDILSNLGITLKDCDTWNGTNDYGLSLVPGGMTAGANYTGHIRDQGDYWSPGSTITKGYRSLRTGNMSITRASYPYIPNGHLCIRCLQD